MPNKKKNSKKNNKKTFTQSKDKSEKEKNEEQQQQSGGMFSGLGNLASGVLSGVGKVASYANPLSYFSGETKKDENDEEKKKKEEEQNKSVIQKRRQKKRKKNKIDENIEEQTEEKGNEDKNENQNKDKDKEKDNLEENEESVHEDEKKENENENEDSGDGEFESALDKSGLLKLVKEKEKNEDINENIFDQEEIEKDAKKYEEENKFEGKLEEGFNPNEFSKFDNDPDNDPDKDLELNEEEIQKINDNDNDNDKDEGGIEIKEKENDNEEKENEENIVIQKVEDKKDENIEEDKKDKDKDASLYLLKESENGVIEQNKINAAKNLGEILKLNSTKQLVNEFLNSVNKGTKEEVEKCIEEFSQIVCTNLQSLSVSFKDVKNRNDYLQMLQQEFKNNAKKIANKFPVWSFALADGLKNSNFYKRLNGEDNKDKDDGIKITSKEKRSNIIKRFGKGFVNFFTGKPGKHKTIDQVNSVLKKYSEPWAIAWVLSREDGEKISENSMIAELDKICANKKDDDFNDALNEFLKKVGAKVKNNEKDEATLDDVFGDASGSSKIKKRVKSIYRRLNKIHKDEEDYTVSGGNNEIIKELNDEKSKGFFSGFLGLFSRKKNK